MFSLLDRRGGMHALVHQPGDTVATALQRNFIPPTTVITLCGESDIVADEHVIDPGRSYVAKLIEGYDIDGIRRLFSSPDSSMPYVHRRMRIGVNGKLDMQRTPLDVDGVARHVEATVRDTIEGFGLIATGDKIVLGLSGGVDSGSLLMLLSAYRAAMATSGVEIHAATFKDFDSKWSETFDLAARLADSYGVAHSVLDAEIAERVFQLNRPLAQILMQLMETDDAHLAMYVDHHTTRRVLEVHADNLGSAKVALGLHTTDLLAGLLNSLSTGFDIGAIPQRTVGPFTYVLPLAFVPKRELHLYYLNKTGHEPKQTEPNQWEFNPSDRNFYYYLADQLQWQWPGVETWMFTAHSQTAPDLGTRFKTCGNCGASVLDQQTTTSPWLGTCDVCVLLDKHGWIAR
jgi:tRNA(Ile)-lysidine synthase TilS/MesJ